MHSLIHSSEFVAHMGPLNPVILLHFLAYNISVPSRRRSRSRSHRSRSRSHSR